MSKLVTLMIEFCVGSCRRLVQCQERLLRYCHLGRSSKVITSVIIVSGNAENVTDWPVNNQAASLNLARLIFFHARKEKSFV